MKKTLFLFVFAALIFGTHSLSAKNLWAYLTYATFNSPQGPYVETS